MQTCEQALRNAFESRERLVDSVCVAAAAVVLSGLFAYMGVVAELDALAVAGKYFLNVVAVFTVARCVYLLWVLWRAEQVLARAEI